MSDEIERLIKKLRDKDGKVRSSAAETLGEIGDPRAVKPLIAALGDEDWGVRESVAKALKKINNS